MHRRHLLKYSALCRVSLHIVDSQHPGSHYPESSQANLVSSPSFHPQLVLLPATHALNTTLAESQRHFLPLRSFPHHRIYLTTEGHVLWQYTPGTCRYKNRLANNRRLDLHRASTPQLGPQPETGRVTPGTYRYKKWETNHH